MNTDTKLSVLKGLQQTLQDLKKMSKHFPNDQDLGKAIRLYLKKI
jgi:hypothetical protein